MAENVEYILRLKDLASSVLSGFKRKTDEAENSMSKLKSSLSKGLAAIGVGLIAKEIYDLGTNAEMTQVAFETFLGSTEKAKKLREDIMGLSAATPFDAVELTEHTKRLLAYGYAQEEIIPNLKAMGEIAAGVGKDKFGNLITAFGQIRAKGRLMGQEMLQLTETGLPILEELSKVTGFSKKEITDSPAKLGITFDQVQRALANMTGEGGKFFGLMDKQSQTIGGKMSTLWDNLKAKAIGVFDSASPMLGKIIDGASYAAEWITTNFAKLKDVFRPMYDAVQPVWKAIKGIAIDLGLANSEGSILSTIFNAIGTIVRVISPLISVAAKITGFLLKGLFEVVKVFGRIFKGIAQFFGIKMKDFAFDEPVAKNQKFETLSEYLAGKGGGGKANLITREGRKGTAGGSSINGVSGTRPTTFNINIQKLVEKFEVNTTNLSQAGSKIKEEVQKALMSAINDAQIIGQ